MLLLSTGVLGAGMSYTEYRVQRGDDVSKPIDCKKDMRLKADNFSKRLEGRPQDQVFCEVNIEAPTKAVPPGALVFNNYNDYNDAWARRRSGMKLQTIRQSNSECVCNAMANVLSALIGEDRELITVQKLKDSGVVCDDHDLFSPFGELAKGTSSRLAPGSQDTVGTVIGGLEGFVGSGGFTDPMKAFEKMAVALDEGRVVAISLSASRLWQALASTNPVFFSPAAYRDITGSTDFFDGHAVRVIGLLRGRQGEVAGFTLADTALIGHIKLPNLDPAQRTEIRSGIYSVTIEQLLDAYMANPVTRGIYISAAKPYRPMVLDLSEKGTKSYDATPQGDRVSERKQTPYNSPITVINNSTQQQNSTTINLDLRRLFSN